jgi:hypothetical protein
VRQRRRQHRTGVDELLGQDIDAEIETFERSNAEEREVALFGEDDLVHCHGSAGMNDRVSNIALNATPVGDDEGSPPLDSDAEESEDGPRDPGELTARVDEGVGDVLHNPALRDALDADRRAEDSHLRHCIAPSRSLLYQYTAITIAAILIRPPRHRAKKLDNLVSF